MFSTKDKKLALMLAGNDTVETIKEQATTVFRAKENAYRNCNFERYIMEEIKTEKDLIEFKDYLKEEQENDRAYWNSDNVFIK